PSLWTSPVFGKTRGECREVPPCPFLRTDCLPRTAAFGKPQAKSACGPRLTDGKKLVALRVLLWEHLANCDRQLTRTGNGELLIDDSRSVAIYLKCAKRIFVVTNPVQHAETLDDLAVRYRQLLGALNSGRTEDESVRELLAVRDNIAVL